MFQNTSPIIYKISSVCSIVFSENRCHDDLTFTIRIDVREKILMRWKCLVYYLRESKEIDYLRTIKDPEYPMNLEQLNVVQVTSFCVTNCS